MDDFGNTIGTAFPLIGDQTLSGLIEVTDDFDVFSVFLTAGQKISVDVTPASFDDPLNLIDVELFNQSLTFGDFEFSLEPGDPTNISFTAPTTETYYIAVSGGFNLTPPFSTETGGYTLVVDLDAPFVDLHGDNPLIATVVTGDATFDAEIHNADDFDFFSLALTAGQQVVVTSQSRGTADPLEVASLAVVDENGVELGNDAVINVGEIARLDFTAPSTQTYIFAAAGSPSITGFPEASGDYTVTFDFIDPNERADLMASISIDQQIQDQNRASVIVTLANDGQETAQNVRPRIVLSEDEVIDTNDQTLDLPGPFTVAPGETIEFLRLLTFPDQLAAGTYRFGVLADGFNTIDESDETNNTGTTAAFTFDGGPPDPEDPPSGGVITGTDGTETLTGTEGNDEIDALGGDDRVNGLGGADLIYGGEGEDSLGGGAGDDQIFGGPRNDLIRAGDGNDLVDGETFADRIFGDAGNDTIFGNQGNDDLLGRDGDDVIYGGDDRDNLIGEAGNDTLFGGASFDRLNGGEGADLLYGGDLPDQLRGADGDDSLFGGGSNDLMFGNAGNDTLDGGAGQDNQVGNEGEDLIYGGADRDKQAGGTENDVIYGGSGADRSNGEAGDDLIFGGDDRDLIFGGTGNDTAFGDGDVDVILARDGDDQLYGGEDGDKLYGEADNDILFGGAGIDFLFAGSGDDTAFGGDDRDIFKLGTGNDTASGGSGDDNVRGQAGDDSIAGDDGLDFLLGEAGNDSLDGGADADRLDGGLDDDFLFGGAGNDSLNGNLGDDEIYGGDGIDLVRGGAGNDTLAGGLGNDTLIGEAGDDTFIFSLGFGTDRVLGFGNGDRIGVETVDPSAALAPVITQLGGNEWRIDAEGGVILVRSDPGEIIDQTDFFSTGPLLFI